MADDTKSGQEAIDEIELGHGPGSPEPAAGASSKGPAPQGTDADVRSAAEALASDEALRDRAGVAFSPSQLVMAIVSSILITPPNAPGGATLTPEQRAAGFAQLTGTMLEAVDFDGNVIALLERGGVGANLSPGVAVGIGLVAIVGGAFLYRTPKAQRTPAAQAQTTARQTAAAAAQGSGGRE